MVIEWTPTADEVALLRRDLTLRTVQGFTFFLAAVWLVLFVLYLSSDGVADAAIGAAIPFIALPVIAPIARAQTRRTITTIYPVGRTATAEATDEGLRVVTAVESYELPWSGLGAARPGAVVLRVKDTLTKRRLLIPRQLFPDDWLPRIGGAPGGR